TLKNEGSVEHDFAVPDLDFTITQVPPGQEKTGTFYAAKSGTFDIVCTVPGHKEAGMVGKLKVR
ncbi:MAG: nitrite reductase, copper-containing, partial [Clostridia bacterium]|nr:nitrite reductase, copper-containing [Clostridia bacterium]